MVRLVRGAVVAFVAVLVAILGAGPASAALTPSPGPTVAPVGCQNPTDTYGAPQICQFSVSTVAPVCDNDVPYLTYNVASAAPAATVNITWINPGGDDVVYADQGLSGEVLWPGAVPGPGGKGVDWPGWQQLPDGTWVEGDEFDWVRPSVQVQFQSGDAEATVTVGYPPSTPTCLTSPPDTEVLVNNPVTPTTTTVVLADPGSTSTAVLSATGSEVQPLLMAGAALVLIGGVTVALVSIARRRRTTA
ncbi:hypothetical protein [Cellulomonas sp. Leaf395]|uniref:hypothetical protein n=1 Tax=Cellulomonas sp. Leaf395 TaxID=1736362 RepID=UPI0006FFEB9B|nr:hypothetical protein [Cellulomonas sp. Leaf395]KQT02242.1 hypothetical protein ASG23_02545 [Cellulomonas sp. Leaf395]